MNDQESITVSLRTYLIGDEMVKVEVQLDNVPMDLFGAAFHLILDGIASEEWELYKYEIGNVFGEAGDNMMVLVSPKREPKNELVVGVSLKRDAIMEAQDGTLISFYLMMEKTDKLSMRFEQAVLSVLKEQRTDLENVIWKATEVGPGVLADDALEDYLQSSVLVGAGAGVRAEAVAPATKVVEDDFSWMIYALPLGICVLICLLFVAWHFVKSRR